MSVLAGLNSPQGLGGLLTSGGGISPMQQALAQYTTGQDIVKTTQDFTGGERAGHGGPGISTMATQAFAGDRFAGAKQAAEASQKDAAAQAASINSQFGQLSSGLGSVLAKAGGGGGSTA